MKEASKAMWKTAGWTICGTFAACGALAAVELVRSACLHDPDLVRRLQNGASLLIVAAGIFIMGLLLLDLIIDDQPNGPAHMPPGRADDSGHVPAGRDRSVGPGARKLPACDGRSS